LNISAIRKKFRQKRNVQFPSHFAIAVPSPCWTSAMEFMLEACTLRNIDFYWIKHGTQFSSPQNNAIIIEFLDEATYAEQFFFDCIEKIEEESWILRLDSDEVLSPDYLTCLKIQVEGLDRKTIYGLPRIWVQKINSEWKKSNRAKSLQATSDFQYRLFHSSGVCADRRIHTSGISAKYKFLLKNPQPIIHLLWVTSSLDSRIAKIRQYESIKEGAGIGKIRYYLPEVYPLTSGWEKLENLELSVLESWHFKDREANSN
jgi:hypothetical protein